MNSLIHRSYVKELLDQDSIPFDDIKRNMQELEFINRYLGGHAITIKGFKQLLERNHLTVCELGCGGGDNLHAIYNWCQRLHIDVKCVGVDINQECVAYARERSDNHFRFITSDYKRVKFEQKPDIIFSSLFCHHFTDDELVFQLKWMKENSVSGFFINDLHRHPIAYHAIKAATNLFSRSYLVRNDAAVSVSRAFKKHEWKALLEEAGITNYHISWQWAFRHLITVQNEW
jgi:2-polyprenyl-3-methyl-5-hydroxy-6-metoxy-1,4-benzoquinol methylase